MVLAGWAPELRDKDVAGSHPYSTSALGYQGFVRLLEAQGYPVEISRLERTLEESDWGLLILTLPLWGGNDALEDFDSSRTTLLVLPKWDGIPDALDRTKQHDTRFKNARVLNDLLDDLNLDATIGRIEVPATVDGAFGTLSPKPDL